MVQHRDIDDLPVADQRHAIVPQPFGGQPRIEAEPCHQIGQRCFENPGPDAPEHILWRLPLDDQAINSCLTQQMPQQQASRPSADDRNLGLHNLSCCSSESSTR